MELSKFLQQDIIDFLDEKTTEQREKQGSLRNEELSLFDVDRDYAKETAKALEQNNLKKAKKIFGDLRAAYNRLQDNDADREKLYAILEEVYAEIKGNIDHGASLAEELQDFEKNELKNASAKLPSDGNPALPDDEETKAFEEAALKAEQERKKAEKDISRAEKAVGDALQKKDLQTAVQAYNTLKETFAHYPSDDKFRKVEWYNQVIAAYEQIKRLQSKLEKEIIEKKKQTAAERKQQEERERQERKIQEQLNKVKEKVKQLINSLDRGDLHATEALLIDARHLVAKLDKSVDKEKQGLETILNTVTHRIQYLKQEQERARRAEERRRREALQRQQEAARKKQEEERLRQEEEKRKKEEAAKHVQEEEQHRKEEEERQKKEEAARREKEEREAIIRAKGNAEELYQEGLRYQHAGEAIKARACYEEILKISPHHLPAQIRLEQLRQDSNQQEAQAP